MSLSNQQFKFAKDVILLLNFALSRGWKFTFGEAQRTKEQQQIYLDQGKSQTMKSLHLERLAIDINFFKPERVRLKNSEAIASHSYTTSKKDLQELGDFWESLDPLNEWGGNWKTFLDTPHFQRNKK